MVFGLALGFLFCSVLFLNERLFNRRTDFRKNGSVSCSFFFSARRLPCQQAGLISREKLVGDESGVGAGGGRGRGRAVGVEEQGEESEQPR